MAVNLCIAVHEHALSFPCRQVDDHKHVAAKAMATEDPDYQPFLKRLHERMEKCDRLLITCMLLLLCALTNCTGLVDREAHKGCLPCIHSTRRPQKSDIGPDASQNLLAEAAACCRAGWASRSAPWKSAGR